MENNEKGEVFTLMYKLHQIIREKMSQSFDKKKITVPQYMALSYIGEKKEVQMKDLSIALSIEGSTATSLLNKLDKLKLINRLINSDDRRIVRVSLTEKGEKTLQSCKKDKVDNMKKMLSYLTDQQKNDMKNILQTLVRNSK